MRLVPLTYDDAPLVERMECDPVLMAELGGPAKPEDIPDLMRRRLGSAESESGWNLKILPNDDSDEAAGSISIWERNLDGEPIVEIGWMVLREYQGQGLATRAVREVLQRARERPGWDVVYAFPAVTNGASNAICRKAGFTFVRDRQFQFRGKTLHTNMWRIDLRETT